MSHRYPTQAELQEYRTPAPELVEFVKTLEHDRVYFTDALWAAYNGKTGYMWDTFVFNYAIRHAGMTLLGKGLVRT